MTPKLHETNNANLTPPPGHNEALVMKFPERKPKNIAGWCEDLPVTVLQEQQNEPRQIVSFWAPSRDEIEAIKHGALIALTVYGNVHPMVWVGTEADFDVRARKVESENDTAEEARSNVPKANFKPDPVLDRRADADRDELKEHEQQRNGNKV